MTFGNWNESVHDDLEQYKRLSSMQDIKTENITVFPEKQCAQITGSEKEPYDVTLNSCTCRDFTLRHLPCKHIYRLASELGYLDDLPKPDKTAAKAFEENVPSEIDRFKDAYFNGAISLKKFTKIVAALKSK